MQVQIKLARADQTSPRLASTEHQRIQLKMHANNQGGSLAIKQIAAQPYVVCIHTHAHTSMMRWCGEWRMRATGSPIEQVGVQRHPAGRADAVVVVPSVSGLYSRLPDYHTASSLFVSISWLAPSACSRFYYRLAS